MELFKKSALTYIKNNPNSNLSGYYRHLLYNESKNPNYLNWIIKHNLNSYYYEIAYSTVKNNRDLKDYPINFKNKVYKNTVDELYNILRLGDSQIVIMLLNKLEFSKGKTLCY